MHRFMCRPISLVILFYVLAASHSLGKEAVHLIQDNSDGIVLTFTLPPYTIDDLIVDGRRCQSIVVEDAAYSSEKGAPQLPFFSQSIILPDNLAMALEIIDYSFREISVGLIVPSKGIIYRNQNPAAISWVFGEVYNANRWYPDRQAVLGRPFIMRDFRGAVVYFHPFQYNAALGKMRVVESITVRLKTANGVCINPLYSSKRRVSAAFSTIYQRHFINFDNQAVRNQQVNDGENMIVISAAAYKKSMLPFVEWKNRKGIKTVLYEYPLETGGSGADSLRSFIQQKYNTDSISYILLVGDAADIPTLKGTVSGLSDPSFVKLAGDDHYPDAFIGRFSVQSVAHADAMVNKLLYYEKSPELGGAWYAKAIGMANKEDGGTGLTDEDWMDEMGQMMLNSTYTHIDKIYESTNSTTSQAVAALNEGRGWFNYQGHGTETSFGFSTATIMSGTFKTLKNSRKLPVIICVACNTGEFDNKYECIAEVATRLDSTGAIAFLGSYISQPFTPPQHGQREIVRLLSENAFISLGAIVYNGTSKILEVGNSTGEHLETFETWTLFGDPSLLVYSSAPTVMAITYPQTVQTGAQEVEIGLEDSVEGRVCLYSEENGILASSIIAGTVSVKLPVTVTTEKKISLTVTARNRMPVMKEIAVGTDAIVDNSNPVNNNAFTVKRTGNAIVFHVPLNQKYLITISDLRGKSIAVLHTNPEQQWYRIRDTFSSGMHIVNIQGNDRLLARKVLFVR